MNDITIPMPKQIPQLSGVHSTTFSMTDSMVCTRFTKSEKEAVQKAADALKMSRSNFIRWCAVQAATVVNKIEIKSESESETKEWVNFN